MTNQSFIDQSSTAVRRPVAKSPEGWHCLRVTTGFLYTVGPISWTEDNGVLRMGFCVGATHCNPVGSCHGGMLAAFADIVLGFGVGHAVGNGAFIPTI